MLTWKGFVEHLKGLDDPYRGSGDFDDVVNWLQLNGHNHSEVEAKGQVYELKSLWDARPGKKLDLSTAADEAERQAEIDRRVKDGIDHWAKLQGFDKTHKTKHTHDVKVGSDRVAYDKKGGYSHIGEFFSDVVKAGSQNNPTPDRLERWTKATLSTYGQENVGADGGFTVPTEFQDRILIKVQGEDSILSRTDQITIGTGNAVVVPYDEDEPWNTSGIQAEWSGEAGTMTQRKPLLTSKELKLRKLVCLVPLTDELMSDSSSIGSYVASKAADVIDFKVGEAIFRGVGAAQPLGFLNGGSLISVTKEASQILNTVIAINVIKMWSRLYGPWRRDAVWFINQTVETELYQMSLPGRTSSGGVTSTFGRHLFVPAEGLSAAPYGTLMGRPVIVTEHCEEVGDAGDIVLASMRQYATLTKGAGIESSSSMHLWFDQDMTALKFRIRLDGQPWAESTIAQRDNTSNTYSAFVTLAARD
jgi:HK97 family phage major capsid protein